MTYHLICAVTVLSVCYGPNCSLGSTTSFQLILVGVELRQGRAKFCLLAAVVLCLNIAKANKGLCDSIPFE